MDDIAIKVEAVSKLFKLPHEKQSSLKSAFVNILRSKKGYEMQAALKDVSFEVKKGEFFGIVGKNGSGKSTLLKLLAGIYVPTSGSIAINGKLTPFIELGVGFNPELTGRENVYLNGALLGFSRKEMQKMYKDIVDFAELKRFMDQKLKNYSSGMQVRLAFSIAIRAQSDILLIDEVLAVGDAAFQQKCYDYFRQLKKGDSTVVFVSHDRGAIENFCDRCILVNDGEIIETGEPGRILLRYNEVTLDQIADAEKSKELNKKKRWGNKNIEITDAKTVRNKFAPNEQIEIKVSMKSHKGAEKPVYGIVIRNSRGEPVFTTNTKVEKVDTGLVKAGEAVEINYEIDNIFGNGSYTVSPAVANEDTNVFYDWRDNLIKFHIAGWDNPHTEIHPKHNISLKKG
ncbi:ABC transporter ATP-binding protein [Candidatus Saccharibacteria bacterium]|nr:ABC transporter ATP-binding protein [Candidatus Saccharibacteria bacterium]